MKLLDNLANGKLPTVDVNTGVEIKSGSLVNLGLVLFITFGLIFLAWYSFRKLV